MRRVLRRVLTIVSPINRSARLALVALVPDEARSCLNVEGRKIPAGRSLPPAGRRAVHAAPMVERGPGPAGVMHRPPDLVVAAAAPPVDRAASSAHLACALHRRARLRRLWPGSARGPDRADAGSAWRRTCAVRAIGNGGLRARLRHRRARAVGPPILREYEHVHHEPVDAVHGAP